MMSQAQTIESLRDNGFERVGNGTWQRDADGTRFRVTPNATGAHVEAYERQSRTTSEFQVQSLDGFLRTLRPTVLVA